MRALVRVKQKETNSVCDVCTKEDCRFFERIEKNKRYYQACKKDFTLNYGDAEDTLWCGGCRYRVSDYFCLACANERMDSLRTKLP